MPDPQPIPSRPKVLLAMSGGVDSSVAAALLRDDGYEVVGCFMRLGSPGERIGELQPGEACDTKAVKIGKQGCCSVNDADDARLVAAKLDIPFYVCNFKRDFGRIIDYFVDEYNAGRTPNPCVRCNDWLKFGRLHDYARQIGASYVASGHYARIDRTDPTRPQLCRGVDHGKDQSYVLFGAQRDQLDEMLLPVGSYQKSEIRNIARELDLPVFDKPDSQEICFVPDNDYASLVRKRTPEAFAPGAIVDNEGNTVGQHDGHQHFTVGQRRGVGVAFGYPIYVTNKDPVANTITVGRKSDLFSLGCRAAETNWFTPPVHDWIDCTVKIRYNSTPVPGQVRAVGEHELETRFDDPQSAVAPGQAVVCYDGDRVVCGGWITTAV